MKLVHGGLAKLTVNGIQISVAPKEQAPFSVEVMVFEEDTNLILTVDKVIRYREEHPIRVMTDILNSKQTQPGSLVKNGNSWYAVVIDINEDKMCRVEWISEAYDNIFNSLAINKINAAGIHLLGQHGKISAEQAVRLLLEKLSSLSQSFLKKIWLIVSEPDIKAVKKQIEEC